MALLPITAFVECDGGRGLCRETLEVRLLRPAAYLREIEQAVDENGWALESDGYKCNAHKWAGRVA